MGNVTIQGELVKPDGTPQPEATIRLTALENTGAVKITSNVDIECTSLGEYTFPLEYGYYKVQVKFDRRWELLGNIIVGSSTPTPIDLGTLLEAFTQPSKPEAEAPMDGGIYGRQNAHWVPIPEVSEMVIPLNGTSSIYTHVHNKSRRPRILFIDNAGMEVELGRRYPSDDQVTVMSSIPLHGTLYIT